MALGLIALVQSGKEPILADLGVGKSTFLCWYLHLHFDTHDTRFHC